MLKITYAAGSPVCNFALEDVYQDLLAGSRQGDVEIVCSTGNLFLRVRGGVREGDIAHEDVEFYFQGKKVEMEKDGGIEDWPVGFLDTLDNLFSRLFGE